MKTGVGKYMRETNSPMRLWCYACERRAANVTPTENNIFLLQVMNPYMATLVDMGDISNLCQFVWYEWVYFFQKTAVFPFHKEELGRCIGTTNNDGNEMCKCILHQNWQVFPRQTKIKFRSEELNVTNDTESNKRADFDAEIQ